MSVRAASHALVVSVPAGTDLYVSTDYMPIGKTVVDAPDTIIYRSKRYGKWLDKAMWENRLIDGVLRRAYVNWRDCVIAK